MNHTNYKKWLQERLIPNLKPSSVVVVDNASYHNVQINGTQPATPEKLKCCAVWVSMVYGTAPT
jgi:predicted O-methyltransferase YrrM